jgi:hypothetical protein
MDMTNIKDTASSDERTNVGRMDIFCHLKGTYWFSRIVFLRGLALIYFVAFAVALGQNKQLIGDNGLTPLRIYMRSIAENNSDLYRRVVTTPTILWLLPSFDDVDWALDALSTFGLCISATILISGAANMVSLIFLWGLYHSIVAVGQTWYSFGW